MKRVFVFSIFSVMVNIVLAQPMQNPVLWYTAPADASIKDVDDGWKNDEEWLKALPVGNGFIGAMVFGDVNRERIQLNDKTLWSGSVADNDNPEAFTSLQEIRNLLFAGKYKEATELTNRTQVCKGAGSGNGNGSTVPYGCFQTLGDLWIDFGKHSTYKNYYRDLDLMTGIASVVYEQDRIQFKREIFASYPAKALIVRLTASTSKAISFSLELNRPERFNTRVVNNGLVMSGVMNDGRGSEGMRYKVMVVPVVKGGKLLTDNNKLIVKKATEVMLVITSSTDYRLHYPDYKNNDFEEEPVRISVEAVRKGFAELRREHINDFSGYMNRVSLKLGKHEQSVPTDLLLQRNKQTQMEPGLYALYFQYGRYLLLSSSRQGSLPANLQGIWANKIQTPWNGDYHTDVNIQMNYWPAEVTNLSETHLQMTELIASLQTPGARTARVQYRAGGWVMHPITNVWGYTAPGEHPSWGLHVGASAWMCQHLWEHYAFTLDEAYLNNIFPILKSASAFYLDWLVRDPVSGKLVSGPAASPENTFRAPDGSVASISMGPSHDHQVIHDLFRNTIAAANVLGQKDTIIAKIEAAIRQIPDPAIGSDGRLMEWSSEFEELEPQHRHVSHLFALYPGNQISFYKTPDWAQAARKSLERRGDGGTGWSLAMKIGFWARLHDGDHALKLLNRLLNPVHSSGVEMTNSGGTYNNLFCAHPPFQIDGNFGATAGIAEMLLQSHEDFIELLPALPSSWKEGEVKGLCARGGFEISMTWKDGQLQDANLLSKQGGSCKIRYGEKIIEIETSKGSAYSLSSLL